MRRLVLLGLAIFPGQVQAADAVARTYHRDIEPILQRHCQECHRPGQVAPWPLTNYSQARKMAPFLANVTRDRQMPPWHASTTEGGPFRDARVLSDAEIAAIADWQKAGAPEGDPKDAPPPRHFESDWPLGTPDLVLKPSEAYKLPGEGADEFRVFVIPSGLKEGKWIGAVDFRPGNPTVVHHVLAAIDTTGRARKMDEADPGPGYKTFAGFGGGPGGLPFIPSGGLSGWAPGKAPRYLPNGVGRYLPAGSDVLLQVHYHKSGRPETDATAIALYFAKAPVDKLIRGAAVFPPRPGPFRKPTLCIPAGDANYAINGTFTVPYDAHASAVVPHMHWLGKDFTLIAERP
ncbi:MAG TPA: ascorbate-dependent monooxygenase, partial [Isosphaeraceae bacterium]